jgi:hypothetical protein
VESLEKNWKELVAIIIGGGLFTFLGSLITQILNKGKMRSEEIKNTFEAEKMEAEADLARARFMTETQNALSVMAKELQAMREKYDLMYEAREAERNAREAERQAERDDKKRIMDEVSSLNAMNVTLNEQVHKMTQTAFERELASQARINELEKRVQEQAGKVEVIEKKTGSLEDKMPKHQAIPP